MKDNRRIWIGNLVKNGTTKANEKLSFLNDELISICIKNGLTSTEHIEVYEGVIRNIMQICDSRLKNSFANKRRYKEKIAENKNRRRPQEDINYGKCLGTW